MTTLLLLARSQVNGLFTAQKGMTMTNKQGQTLSLNLNSEEPKPCKVNDLLSKDV